MSEDTVIEFPEVKRSNWCASFGAGQLLGGSGWVQLNAMTEEEARKFMKQMVGEHWSFLYNILDPSWEESSSFRDLVPTRTFTRSDLPASCRTYQKDA